MNNTPATPPDTLAAVWDEAVQALAWALDNGPAADALPYVAKNNPYRAALAAASPVAADAETTLARAWDEGHRTPKRYGPDNCQCAAWNESECGCGEYGSNVITPNPYRPAPGVSADTEEDPE